MNKSQKRHINPKKTKKKLSDFDISVIVAIIGIVFLIVLILHKTLEFSIPIFGKELDFLGINWKIYVKRNLFWFIISIVMIVFGVTRAITIVLTLKNKIKSTAGNSA